MDQAPRLRTAVDARGGSFRRGRVLIRPAEISDITFVGANMRAADRREILCQLEAGTSGSDAARACFFATPEAYRFVAFIDGQPVSAFGIGPLTAVVWQVWAFGTDRMRRTVPAISRHLEAELVPAIVRAGCRRVEARVFKNHDLAPLWISRLGGIRVPGDLPDHGRDGEVFELWAWTLTQYERSRHVLQSPKGEGSA